MATYHTPAVNFQASYVENLHDTAKMLIFAALLCRPPAPPWACTHKKLLGWWNGRHEGLKILWPLRLCGFKSRSEYKTIAGYLVAGDFLFLPQKLLHGRRRGLASAILGVVATFFAGKALLVGFQLLLEKQLLLPFLGCFPCKVGFILIFKIIIGHSPCLF